MFAGTHMRSRCAISIIRITYGVHIMCGRVLTIIHIAYGVRIMIVYIDLYILLLTATVILLLPFLLSTLDQRTPDVCPQ